MPWTLDDALPLIRQIERACPSYGCHVGLTGGVLYKGGARKDLDLIFYRIRQWEKIDTRGLQTMFKNIGVEIKSKHGWMWKADHYGDKIDIFFPESAGNGYYPDPNIAAKPEPDEIPLDPPRGGPTRHFNTEGYGP